MTEGSKRLVEPDEFDLTCESCGAVVEGHSAETGRYFCRCRCVTGEGYTPKAARYDWRDKRDAAE